ncbi:uncharacterized protein JN550_004887 [Neoarthrinium moseri]|uniref:uncharacterized protein n=1 Tax=Neoarthrinium moseri TaxID=1658444 RepID=UPI001FDD0C4A|nr:uncharacterized protein JN550_004887 [Neoarthrinium moseri]KAI1870741.1 hypothetical protein JN550_004887 [Neoarthrinium moseri]
MLLFGDRSKQPAAVACSNLFVVANADLTPISSRIGGLGSEGTPNQASLERGFHSRCISVGGEDRGRIFCPPISTTGNLSPLTNVKPIAVDRASGLIFARRRRQGPKQSTLSTAPAAARGGEKSAGLPVPYLIQLAPFWAPVELLQMGKWNHPPYLATAGLAPLQQHNLDVFDPSYTSPPYPNALPPAGAPRPTMATIEPRLIHLLNESTATPKPHHNELPPIKGLSLPKPSGRQHPPPIEPDAGHRNGGPDISAAGQLASQSIPPLFSMTDDSLANTATWKDTNYGTERNLLHHISSQDLRKILDDTTEASEDPTAKKRPVKEDFVQLPQPLKKQKATSEVRFPPMIVGLVQPPTDAALFPPISSASFDHRPRSEPPKSMGISKPPETLPTTDDKAATTQPPDAEKTPTGRIKRRAAKPRRKWTEEETNHLLLGVSKYGVGRWTDILEDRQFKFNERTAGDLKDRFRTCCPEELRATAKAKQGVQQARLTAAAPGVKPKKGLMSENILNEPKEPAEPVEPVEPEQASSTQNDSDSAPRQRKSRAHRKKLEDLAELGIKGPFKTSQRRNRRPFSEQDDREILEGFEIYGPQWTRIQRDSRFHLANRQPTDLRDRLRNKYPEKFASTEKTAMQIKEASRGNSLLEPSVDMTIGHSLDKNKSALLEPQLIQNSSKEDMPKWPISASLMETAESSQAPSHVFWNEAAGTAFPSGSIGEMDISRLLLDDTQIAQEPSLSEKRGLG